MKNVYEVRYELLSKSLGEKRACWSTNNEPIHVLANGSARAAIEKAERHLLRERTSWTDEDGKKRIEVNVKVRVTSCERVLSIDV